MAKDSAWISIRVVQDDWVADCKQDEIQETPGETSFTITAKRKFRVITNSIPEPSEPDEAA